MSASAAPFPVNREDLGPFEHTYGSGGISAVRVFAYVASALAFGLGVFFLKLNQEIAVDSEIQGLPQMAALLVFSLSFVCLLGGMLHKPKSKRVLLFENGLAFEDTTKAQTASWEEILHYRSCASGEPFRFSLTNGTEISIPKETTGFVDLCNAIRIRAGEHIFQREYALIKRGGKSEFGPLAFSLDGFSIDGMQIDWQELNQVSNNATKGSERLIFETHALAELGPSVPTSRILSAQVCYRLIEQLAQIRVLSAL